MGNQDIYRQLGVAIHETQAGRKDIAREILLAILRQDPRNETAWGWMATVVDTPQERQFCLRKVLELNPDNTGARDALERDDLGKPAGTEPFAGWTPAAQPRPAPAEASKSSLKERITRGTPAEPPGVVEKQPAPVGESTAPEAPPLEEDPIAAIEWVLGGAITPDQPRSAPDAPHYAGSHDVFARERRASEESAPRTAEFDEPPPLEGEDFLTAESRLDEILGPLPGIQRLRRAVSGRSRVVRPLEEEDEGLPRDRWAFVRATPEARSAVGGAPGALDEPPEDLFAGPVSKREPEPAQEKTQAPVVRKAKPRRRRFVVLVAALIVVLILFALAATLLSARGGGAAPTPTPTATPGAPTEASAPRLLALAVRLETIQRMPDKGLKPLIRAAGMFLWAGFHFSSDSVQ